MSLDDDIRERFCRCADCECVPIAVAHQPDYDRQGGKYLWYCDYETARIAAEKAAHAIRLSQLETGCRKGMNFYYCVFCGSNNVSDNRRSCENPSCHTQKLKHIHPASPIAVCPYSEIDALKLSDTPYDRCDAKHPLTKYYNAKDKEGRDRVIASLPGGVWPRSLCASG